MKKLTPEERHKLALAPLPTIRIYEGKAHGGTAYRSIFMMPVRGRRSRLFYPEDEEMVANHKDLELIGGFDDESR